MSIRPLLACSVVIAALALAQGASAQNRPSGAVDQNVNGVTYFSYGGAYYRPIYSGSSVYYEVVENPA